MGSSNINMNELSYDLHCFKSLKSLKVNRMINIAPMFSIVIFKIYIFDDKSE